MVIGAVSWPPPDFLKMTTSRYAVYITEKLEIILQLYI